MKIYKVYVRLVILGLFSVLLLSACENEISPKLLLEAQSIQEVLEFETESTPIHDVEISPAPKNFFPGRDSLELDNALIFLNTSGAIPLKTKYFYSKKDSTILLTVYEWNKVTPGLSPQEVEILMSKEMKNHDIYEKIFYDVALEISKKYGKVSSGDGVLEKKGFSIMETYTREAQWDLKDKIADLKMILIPSKGYHIYKVILKIYPKI